MHPEMELLQYIYKTADMGCAGIDSVMGHVKQAPLQKELERQQGEYGRLRDLAETMITPVSYTHLYPSTRSSRRRRRPAG